MKLPPRPKGEPIITKRMLGHIFIQAAAIFICVAAAFLIPLTNNNGFFFSTEYSPLDGARTVAFATLIISELLRAYAARSERMSVFKLGLFTNKFMNMSVLVSLALLAAVIYIPVVNGWFDNVALSLTAWLVIVPLALIPFATSEIYKLIRKAK